MESGGCEVVDQDERLGVNDDDDYESISESEDDEEDRVKNMLRSEFNELLLDWQKMSRKGQLVLASRNIPSVVYRIHYIAISCLDFF